MISEAYGEDKSLTGIFYDSPAEGMEYETQTISDTINKKGEFKYYPG